MAQRTSCGILVLKIFGIVLVVTLVFQYIFIYFLSPGIFVASLFNASKLPVDKLWTISAIVSLIVYTICYANTHNHHKKAFITYCIISAVASLIILIACVAHNNTIESTVNKLNSYTENNATLTSDKDDSTATVDTGFSTSPYATPTGTHSQGTTRHHKAKHHAFSKRTNQYSISSKSRQNYDDDATEDDYDEDDDDYNGSY
jgi:hypothetical protein